MWYFSIALKNVFCQKRRSFTLGINYAVVTFILVLLFSFSQGAIRNITTNLVRSTAGHITISGSYTAAGGISAKKAISLSSNAVRTGCMTRPEEKAASAHSMASINSRMERTARTSDSESQRGMRRPPALLLPTV